jgi:hypothetical protein
MPRTIAKWEQQQCLGERLKWGASPSQRSYGHCQKGGPALRTGSQCAPKPADLATGLISEIATSLLGEIATGLLGETATIGGHDWFSGPWPGFNESVPRRACRAACARASTLLSPMSRCPTWCAR